jgi:flagellar motor switch protein FliM
MSRLLSSEEIKALVAGAEVASGGDVIAYNFRRPDRVSKDQIRSLHFLHDRFARNAATSLAAFLRTTAELSIVSVEQFAYSEFLMSLPDPTAFYAVAMPPFEGLGALEVNPMVAFTIIDRMLGGSGEGAVPSRALTEIEQNVVDSVVRLLLEHLTETWKTVTDIQFQVHARETRPQMLQVASWNEVVILLAFDVRVGESRGLLNFCIPASVIEATGTNFVQSFQQTRREPNATEREWLTENLGRVRFGVTADVETRLKTRDLVTLSPGQILSLGVPVDTEVNVRVGGMLKFRGRLAASAGRAAVRISRASSSRPGDREEARTT